MDAWGIVIRIKIALRKKYNKEIKSVWETVTWNGKNFLAAFSLKISFPPLRSIFNEDNKKTCEQNNFMECVRMSTYVSIWSGKTRYSIYAETIYFSFFSQKKG